MSQTLIDALTRHAGEFGLELSQTALDRLSSYYEFVMQHNELLHLVGPCSPEEFATRHILESLTLLEYLPDRVRFADVGAGAGLPSMPCLLVREDLRAVLIEPKEKKARFLEEAIEKLGLGGRVTLQKRQFSEVDLAGCEDITCRALDRFAEKIPSILHWAKRRKLLLFGGDNLREALTTSRVQFSEKLLPLSEKRFLFVAQAT